MILRTDKLSVGYGKRMVVSDINVMLMKGQFVCLLGPNGSGKSTILKTIVRTLAPLDGEIFLNDRKIIQLSNQEMAKTTAVVLTEPVSAGLLSAYDVVMLGRQPHSGLLSRATARDHQIVTDSLNMVNAGNIEQRYFSELSDGEKQKVLLARALAQEPQLIVLDEPTSHLDIKHRIEVMLILRQLTREKGVTVIASLHDIDLAVKVCDVAILIKDEQILACGMPEDVLQEELISQLYGMGRARFNRYLGGIELTSKTRENNIFVVAGAGTGSSVYRLLTKHGYAISTGILPENDIDYQIASSIGATIVNSPAYENISPETYQEALRLLQASSQVIDSGFPLGMMNQMNVLLLQYALESHKPLHVLRDRSQSGKLLKPGSNKLLYSKDYFELISAIKKIDPE
jgi:iron complex transport system ATP-binding protein